MATQQFELPAWDRLLRHAGADWDLRLELLRAADAELRETARRGARVITIDRELAHWAQVRDETRREIVDLERRKATAIERAIEETGQRALLGRAKRVEAAREWADEMQEEQLKGTRQIVNSRLARATRELAGLHDELRDFGTHPMYRDERVLDWLHAVHEVIAAATRRDGRAREMVLRPWLQQRAADHRLVAALHAEFDVVVPAATFAQGAIHLVGGQQLAVVEVRDGDDRIRILGSGAEQRLLQQDASGERPAGATTGTLAELRAVAELVAASTGATARTVVCFLGWKSTPAKVEDTILCGPELLGDVLRALPAQDVAGEALQAAAAVLAERPPPKVRLTDPAPLDEFASLRRDEIPHPLVHLARLVDEAHSPTIDLRESVGVVG